MPKNVARLAPLTIALLLTSAPTRAGEGYRIEGTLHDGFPSIAGRVAILPPRAPGELEQAWIERKLAGHKDMRPKAPLVSLRDVQAAIARLGIDPYEPASRGPLAAELGVDSFLEIQISDLATSKPSQVNAPEGGMLLGKAEKGVAQAKVSFRIVPADSGAAWFELTADGTQLVKKKGIQPIVADMLDKMFERAYPARRYR